MGQYGCPSLSVQRKLMKIRSTLSSLIPATDANESVLAADERRKCCDIVAISPFNSRRPFAKRWRNHHLGPRSAGEIVPQKPVQVNADPKLAEKTTRFAEHLSVYQTSPEL